MFADGVGFVQLADAEPDAPGCDPNLVRLLRLLRKGSSLERADRARVAGLGRALRDPRPGRPPFEPADVDYATAVAGQVAAGIAQAQHVESVARLAYTDPLTGLANRRAVDDRLDAALDRHRRDGTVVSLVVVDVNGLKRINDDRGHEAGDRALVHFAGLLAASAGLLPGSLAGRSGGDEFCVVVEGSTSDHVVWLAEDLCRRANAALDEGIACGVASTDDPIGPVGDAVAAVPAGRRGAEPGQAQPGAAPGGGRPRPAAGRDGPARRRGRAHAAQPEPARGPAAGARPGAASPTCSTTCWRPSTTVPRVGTQERLEVVADAVCRLVDGCSWWVSRTDDSYSVLQTVSYSAIRYGGGLVADQEAVARRHVHVRARRLPAQRPDARGARRCGGRRRPAGRPGRARDPRGCRLHGAGHGRRRPTLSGAGWLVEVYVDDIAGDVSSLASALRALTACAILPPPSPPT